MKTENRKNYIDRDGVPHGDWCRIIGANLKAWNEEQEKNDKTHKED